MAHKTRSVRASGVSHASGVESSALDGFLGVPSRGQDRPAKAGQRGASRALDPKRLILRQEGKGATKAPPKETPELRRERRVGSARIKATAADIARKKSILYCGIKGQEHVTLRMAGGSASYGGARVCKAAWLCPDCSAYLAAKRMAVVQARFEELHRANPGHFFLVTLTMIREAGVPLKDVFTGLSRAHNSMTSGEAWQRIKADLGGEFHFVRGREVMLSPNIAWGPHDHWSVFIPSTLR